MAFSDQEKAQFVLWLNECEHSYVNFVQKVRRVWGPLSGSPFFQGFEYVSSLIRVVFRCILTIVMCQ